ncbi:sulfate adenylyltransferase subunit CysN [Mesorhizobium opportunistum]|uniref:Multifunctional fusion protein n=1 Tax=Mesorhizobium opportunistum TaxID=593909 RepID=A0ABV1YJI7_9HYPH|nr:sulfate adenylyltransferase subunit CysN [Mesorhizobium sp.]TIN98761.1 MAG: sulfate adenylyltransferase subunit CysN [Mesorhizobium sp.]TJU99351.1 MAG: sulfate adenylyltransferase subunit CysN [Mesorhizobium sp.]TJV19234.1 MAG: sulfate adenylyltransferase subunit CysN [Mesorhizobium sp.]
MLGVAQTADLEASLESQAASQHLHAHERKSLLRFLTCGSVDDGKSTLIGRLLYDTQLLMEDQLSALAADSRRHGTTGDDLDFALLVDGLASEREQGITIDVAYRFFATEQRKFIVADTPGHEQYTRNMATGASNADLAVILVDARQGILTQTRRHSFIVSLLGIRHVVLAINKIDLIGYSQAVFDEIEAAYRSFAEPLGFVSLQAIPLSARYGDNVRSRSAKLPWYQGPTLVEYLESVEVDSDRRAAPFRMPVQWVNRPNLDFRGFAGTIAAGVVRPGDRVAVARSGVTSLVKRIVTFDGDLSEAGAGEAVTLMLQDEIDVSRGDVLAAAAERPEVSDQFAAHLLWMHDEPLIPGRPYLIKLATSVVGASVTHIKHRLDINNFAKLATKTLEKNEVGVINLMTQAPLAFDPFSRVHETGAFIVIDRMTNHTVGAGMIDFSLRRASNIHWQALDVDMNARAIAKGQKPAALWFTGLSGAGKSTIANLVEKRLHAIGKHTYLLDGDNVRHGLNRDLGFTDADRVENIRRVAETARLMVDAGLIALASFISPFRAERRMARDLFGEGQFIEIFVDTPLEVAERRDPKGLYQRARNGLIQNFTGIGSPYERPEAPHITITPDSSAEEAAELIVSYLDRGGYLGSATG